MSHLKIPAQIIPRPRGEMADKKGSRSLHVLVVDDEPMVRDVIAEYLAVDGHTCEIAPDGQEGLEKFYQGDFDLVITDNAMPGMNGIQLANQIKQIAPEIPVIMLTGYEAMLAELDEISKGIDLIWHKPIMLAEFRENLAQVIA